MDVPSDIANHGCFDVDQVHRIILLSNNVGIHQVAGGEFPLGKTKLPQLWCNSWFCRIRPVYFQFDLREGLEFARFSFRFARYEY